MFIRSDIITENDILDAIIAARAHGADILIDHDGIRKFKPRRFERGFEFFCEALSGKRSRNRRGGRAASWTAYGLFMADLYKLDPSAEISFYRNCADFMDWTKRCNERDPDEFPAPWLDDATLYNGAEDTRNERTQIQRFLTKYDYRHDPTSDDYLVP